MILPLNEIEILSIQVAVNIDKREMASGALSRVSAGLFRNMRPDRACVIAGGADESLASRGMARHDRANPVG